MTDAVVAARALPGPCRRATLFDTVHCTLAEGPPRYRRVVEPSPSSTRRRGCRCFEVQSRAFPD
ncbi:hypothetical protein M6B38_375105 [Iris pallida]|uniref:Uncharacterized protein n=1 Tax=Iris pallida TaxID=29817 RepID=A0AAX6GB71_IRIPA|nr:hypothetical protein M6B38_375105 [Iris pallida]